MNGLVKSITENVTFVLEFVGIVVAMILIAYLVEKFIQKKNHDTERILNTRKVTAIGMFAAVAGVLMVIEIPMPFAPDFYKLDLSELPVLICGFAFGPVAGVLTEFVKILVKLVIKGTSTAFVGELANFVVGSTLILPATLIYQAKKKKGTAITGCIVGTLLMTIVGTSFNAYYLLPTFAKMYGMPLDALVAMGTEINPSITNVTTFVCWAVAPLNIIKGTAVSVITMVAYKPLSPILKAANVKSSKRVKEQLAD